MITAENIEELANKLGGYIENVDTLCIWDAPMDLMWKRKVGETSDQSQCFAKNPLTGKWDVPFALKL